MAIGSPNIIAYLALFLWVPVTLVAYWKLRPALATIVVIVGGAMFLPEATAIDPPALPPMDKSSMASFWALCGCLWKSRERLIQAKPFRGIDLLFVVVLIGNIGTSLTNPDAIATGPVVRPSLSLYDAFALGIKDTLSVYLPFFLGRAMLRTSRDLKDLMWVLSIGGLVYSVLALVEIRLSPQLHNWIYGFHQMEFSMTVRFGGYRPMIFMRTGMATSMFILSCAIAAWARWKASLARPWLAAWLTVVMVACKSTGTIVYALFAIPLVAALKRPRGWLPAGLALMVLGFPILRGTDVFPTDTLVDWSKKISEDRALSLWFRFDQEDQLLERARERMVFGWGSYDRNRVFDPITGEDLSITDGDWMIQFGTRGVIGFAGLYGMLALAVVMSQRRLKKVPNPRDRVLLAAFALIASLQIVDLLPNGLFHYLPFFFAGSLYGLSEGLVHAAARAKKKAREEKARAAREKRERARARGPRATEEAFA